MSPDHPVQRGAFTAQPTRCLQQHPRITGRRFCSLEITHSCRLRNKLTNLAEASFPGRAPIESAVVQAVCSPIRNPLDRAERRALGAALSRSAAAVARLLARSAGVRPAAVRWEFPGEPTFDNQVASLLLTGRGAYLTIEKTRPEDWATPRLHQTLSRTIA